MAIKETDLITTQGRPLENAELIITTNLSSALSSSKSKEKSRGLKA
jgi:hypothetical protein